MSSGIRGPNATALPLLGLLLIVIAANAPFLKQAFHMDDGIYLLMAQNVPRSPWFPQDRPAYFEGLYAHDLASTEHPLPLTSYVLALAAHFGRGFSEVNLHAGFLVFPVILTSSMYLLAGRFTRHPALATLTLIFLPVVYVLSHTLMTDIPQLALWVASAALFSYGVDSGKKPCAWFGALAATLASFISYSGLCVVPLLTLYAILRKDRHALLVILILPALLFGLWLVLSYVHYQRLTPGQLLAFYFLVKRVLSPVFLIRKCAYIVLAIGAVTIFPLVFLALSGKATLAPGLFLAFPALWFTGAIHYPLHEKALFVLFFCAGAAGMGKIVHTLVLSLPCGKKDDSRGHAGEQTGPRLGAGMGRVRAESEDDLFLAIWFLGMIAFSAAVYMTGSARYFLPATPPLVLLLFRQLERTTNERRLRWVATINLALGGSLAVLIAVADYQFARIYRDFSSAFAALHPKRLNHLWFTGEWGFRAYLERAGGEELGRRDSRPRRGDFLIVPTLATPYPTLFAEELNLESLILVAPSSVAFEIPRVPPDSILVFTIGMPFHDKSDGMNLSVRFVGPDLNRIVYSARLLASEGRRWGVHQIRLREVAGKHGSIAFSAEVGGSGNAEADWVAIAQARIGRRTTEGEIVLYDFREHFKDARIKPEPGVQYHTAQNLPVFPLSVSLEQEPATVLRRIDSYRPATPLRMLDAQVHAGFWCMSWGMLPFSFAVRNSTLETIRVYEVIRDVDVYGESTSLWYEQ